MRPEHVGREAVVESRPAVARPLVSVCISAYNVEAFVAEAIQSILAQSYAELEVIVVDNGSDDGTFDALRALDDERLRTFRLPENIGGYQAMNLVAEQARGDFVAIYHSDDVYEPTIIEEEVDYLVSHPDAGGVFAMCDFIDEAGERIGALDLIPELRGHDYVGYDEAFRTMLQHGNVMFVCPSFMIRRSALSEVGPFDAERWDIASDQEMWLRLTRRYPVGILERRLLRYRRTSQQWTNRWKHLRTDPDRALDVMELYLEQDGWKTRLTRAELAELRYQRCDDDTTRAANAVMLGEPSTARDLLRGRYPYGALFSNVRLRKVRVLLLRGVMKTALALHASAPLARLLRGTEYGEWR